MDLINFTTHSLRTKGNYDYVAGNSRTLLCKSLKPSPKNSKINKLI